MARRRRRRKATAANQDAEEVARLLEHDNANRAEEDALHRAVESSNRVKLTANLRELYVGNLPFDCGSNDVLLALRQHFARRQSMGCPYVKHYSLQHAADVEVVQSCAMSRPKKPLQRHGGHAFVVVNSAAAADFFVQCPEGVVCQAPGSSNRRQLRVAPSSRSRARLTRIVEDSVRLQDGQLRVVDAVTHDVLWASTTGVQVKVLPAKRVLALLFNLTERPPLCSLLEALRELNNSVGNGVEFAMSAQFQLRTLRTPVHVEHLFAGQTAVLTLAARQAPWLFRIQASARPDWDPEEVRTTDPTPSHAFGFPACLFQIVMRGSACREVLDMLRSYGIQHAIRDSTAVSAARPARAAPWSAAKDAAMRDSAAPFEAKYELEKLLAEGRVHVDEVAPILAQLEDAGAVGAEALERLAWARHRSAAAQLSAIVQRLLEERERGSDEEDGWEEAGLRARGEALVKKVLVTPLRVLPMDAEADSSNRILRRYAQWSDRFIRVAFVDEGLGSVQPAATDDVLGRIRALLRDGVVVTGRRFQFLGFGNSQLKQHTTWFYCQERDTWAEDSPPTREEIWAGMGNFSAIKVAGKYAARMGQAFSATVPTIRIPHSRRVQLSDIHDASGAYCFSDGVGVVSADVVPDIVSMLSIKYRHIAPSAFQVRWAGSKGVLAVWPSSMLPRSFGGPEPWIGTRASMDKFEASSCDLEVVGVARKQPFFLNRQVIFVLTTLGVSEQAIECIYLRTVEQLNAAMSNSFIAEQVLEANGCHVRAEALAAAASRFDRQPSMADAYDMLSAGFQPGDEPYLRGLLEAFRARRLLDLQEKARLPVADAVCLIGIMDETGTLPAGCVFFQWREPGSTDVKSLPPGSRVAVGRCPCLHPGDIRNLPVADASSLPEAASAELLKLVDVLVFPRVGDRPLPSQMAGGDLDGDVYFVIWNTSLLFPSNDRPMDYSAIPPKTLPTVTMDHVADFFVDFVKNDCLGEIANLHLAIADQSSARVRDGRCLQLAQLHSKAVDYVKTGVPVARDDVVAIRGKDPVLYPDFMEKPGTRSYESTTVVGRIYRGAKAQRAEPLPQQSDAAHCLDEHLVVAGHALELEDASEMYAAYRADLLEVMNRYGVDDEAQVLSGHVLDFSKKRFKRETRGDVQGRLNREVALLRGEYRQRFFEGLEAEGSEDGVRWTRAMSQRASAWYVACYRAEMSRNGRTTCWSFPWIVVDVLTAIKRARLSRSSE